MSNTYWYNPGYEYPYWWMNDHTAGNADADTDMGNLSPDEFRSYFPHAFEISGAQYACRTIDKHDAVKWAAFLKASQR